MMTLSIVWRGFLRRPSRIEGRTPSFAPVSLYETREVARILHSDCQSNRTPHRVAAYRRALYPCLRDESTDRLDVLVDAPARNFPRGVTRKVNGERSPFSFESLEDSPPKKICSAGSVNEDDVPRRWVEDKLQAHLSKDAS